MPTRARGAMSEVRLDNFPEALRRPLGRCCTRYMILRSLVVRLALGAVWFAAVALTFLVLDLYT
ncbi:hypothetical protein KRMM14A1259_62000 [Krasilnikovia sp. MM14-A1259]